MQQIKLASFMLPDPAPLDQLFDLVKKLKHLNSTIVVFEQIERGDDKFVSVIGYREELTPIELNDKVELILLRMDAMEKRVNDALRLFKPQPKVDVKEH